MGNVAITSSSGGPPGLAGRERPQRQEHAINLHGRVRQQGASDEVALRLPDGLHGAAKFRIGLQRLGHRLFQRHRALRRRVDFSPPPGLRRRDILGRRVDFSPPSRLGRRLLGAAGGWRQRRRHTTGSGIAPPSAET